MSSKLNIINVIPISIFIAYVQVKVMVMMEDIYTLSI